MARTPARGLVSLALALIAIGAIGLAVYGCKRPATEPAPEPPTEPTPPAAATQTYEHIRGRIAKMPAPPAQDFQIHHEAIPGFVNREGKIVGMNEMTMPFPQAEGVSLEGFAAGDAVEFDFDVDWSRSGLPHRLTRITKLPEDAVLSFEQTGDGGN